MITRDGSYECDIVYSNLREAKRAIRLTGTTLGDRTFSVQLCITSSRFRRRSPSERIRHAHNLGDSRTAILTELTTVSEDTLVAICGGRTVVRECMVLEGGREALIEFVDEASMLLAFERLKIATLPDGTHARLPFLSCSMSLTQFRIEAAWRRVDPDYCPAKEVKRESDRRTSSESGSSSSLAPKARSRSRERRGDRGREQERRYRSRSRPRHHRDGSRERRRNRSRSRSRPRTDDKRTRLDRRGSRADRR